MDKIISYAGDTWRIISTGVKRGETIYAHLASMTRFRQQKNGAYPVQMCDYIPADLLK